MSAPIILHLAMTVDGGTKGQGVDTALWVCFAIAAGGALVSSYIFILARARLQRPDLERWEKGDEPAWNPPPLLAGIRPDRHRRSEPPAGGPIQERRGSVDPARA
jgi:hypothetical protein